MHADNSSYLEWWIIEHQYVALSTVVILACIYPYLYGTSLSSVLPHLRILVIIYLEK